MSLSKTDVEHIDVSIILVNYRTSSLCKDVVKSIKDMTSLLTYEIIIVDNSDDCDEFEIINNIKGADKIIKSPNNVGFGNGNNLGASVARGDYLFFLNTDTILMNNAIYYLHKFIESNPKVGVVGPNLYTKNNKPNISYEKKTKSLKTENLNLVSLIIRKIFKRNYFFNHTKKPLKISGYVSGAALMIRRDCFETIGGFEKSIFMYAEESLLCFKVRQMGYDIFNIPYSKIIHFEGGSFNGANYLRASRFVDGNYCYYANAFSKEIAKKYLYKSTSFYKRKTKIYYFLKKKDQALVASYLAEAFYKKYHEVR